MQLGFMCQTCLKVLPSSKPRCSKTNPQRSESVKNVETELIRNPVDPELIPGAHGAPFRPPPQLDSFESCDPQSPLVAKTHG